MKRRNFIVMSPAIAVGLVSLLTTKTKAQAQNTTKMEKFVAEERKNWAGNYTYKAKSLKRPKTVEALQDLMRASSKNKALGSKHCFNAIADSPMQQISTEYLNKLVSIDESAKTVTVESGIRYGELAPLLEQQGYALHNLASLPHISVAGACTTATHGSGMGNGNLASAVVSLELVRPNGQIVRLKRGEPDFYGAVVGLGALGIIARMTLEIEKTYTVRQDLFQNLPIAGLKDHFEEIMLSGYSVSLFTDYQNDVVSQVWVKSRTDEKLKDFGSFYGATAATKKLHPITVMPAENCTDQLGVAGVWYERLPHFKMGFTPSSGKELQSEYFVAKEHALAAYMALVGIKDVIFPQLMISEVRAVAADDFWMSPGYKKDCITFHFTWEQRWEEVKKILPQIEAVLFPFGVLPHWGKMFTLSPEILHARYAKMDDFVALAERFDLKGQFKNSFLDQNIYRS